MLLLVVLSEMILGVVDVVGATLEVSITSSIEVARKFGVAIK